MFATSSQHNLTNMVGLNKFIEFLSLLIDFYATEKNITRCCQLCPRYEGQLTWMAEPIPPSGQSSSYSLTTVLCQDLPRSTQIYPDVNLPRSTDRRAETDMDGLNDADVGSRTILMPFEGKGVLYTWGPVQPSSGPPTRTTSG